MVKAKTEGREAEPGAAERRLAGPGRGLGAIGRHTDSPSKNKAAQSIERRLKKRGDSPRRLYRQENKREGGSQTKAKGGKVTGKDTRFNSGKNTWFRKSQN